MPDSLVSSGLEAVDARWGGLATDGTYLLIGRADGGRSALALQFVRGAVDAGARCLLISPRAPEALVQTASTVGLDLGEAHRTGRLRLLRIPSADALAQRGSDGLDKAYRDFVTLVRTDRPERVVIEDFTPLVQFDSFERFETAFSTLARDIRALGATLIVGLGEPANSTSSQLLDVVKRHVDASIELDAESRQIRLTRQDAAPLDAPPLADDSTIASEDASAEPAPPPAEPAPPPAPPVASPPTPVAPPLPPGAPVGQDPSVARPAQDPERAPEATPEESTPAPEAPTSLQESDIDLPLEDGPDEPQPADSGYPVEGVTAAPPAEASLHGETEDRFGIDPSTVLSHGYLVDSGAIAPATRPEDIPPAFAPLGESASMDPAHAFRSALDHSFSVRVTGTPFLVVAVRMEADAPESVYFPTVADGLRSALRAQDRILVDENRLRAVVLLPASQTDAAQALFAGLQTHLRRSLGDDAKEVLRAVGAVSVPDGQPFSSSRDLMAYAYED